jgi:hypothetical protein
LKFTNRILAGDAGSGFIAGSGAAAGPAWQRTDRVSDGGHVAQNLLGGAALGDFQTKVFFQADDKLQRIDGIQTQSLGTENRRFITNVPGWNL